jgi:Fe-S-cluster containining protein
MPPSQPPHPTTTSSGQPSPLGLAAEVEQLMNLPQSLCKQRGICCKVAVFKGLRSHQELLAMARQDDVDGEMARDFASIFIPYATQTEVTRLAPEFVTSIRDTALKQERDPNSVTFYHCTYLQPDGRCGVHEDRPIGCRKYPIPHKKTLFHPGCGYEATAKRNWARIEAILRSLGLENEFD